jgi:DDE superfamily endonuclease
MDTYTIAAAARLVGAPKGKLYEAIRTGRLQPTPTQASTSALTVTAVALQAVGFAVPASALPPPPTGLDTELSSPSGSRAAPPWPLPQGAPRGRLPRTSAWVMDNLNTHWSLDVCRVVARWCKVPFEPDKLKKGVQRRAFLSDPSHHHVSHFTPMHGSWLNQAELFFGMLQRRFLARGSFSSIKDFERRLECFCKIIMPVMPILTAGPIRGSRSCAIRHSAVPSTSNVRDGRVLVLVPSDLNGYSIR